jgi:hypothetical protein
MAPLFNSEYLVDSTVARRAAISRLGKAGTTRNTGARKRNYGMSLAR